MSLQHEFIIAVIQTTAITVAALLGAAWATRKRQDMIVANLSREEAIEHVGRHVPREQAEHYVSMAGSGQRIPIRVPGLRPSQRPAIELIEPGCYSYMAP